MKKLVLMLALFASLFAFGPAADQGGPVQETEASQVQQMAGMVVSCHTETHGGLTIYYVTLWAGPVGGGMMTTIKVTPPVYDVMESWVGTYFLFDDAVDASGNPGADGTYEQFAEVE